MKLVVFRYSLTGKPHLELVKSSQEKHHYLALDAHFPGLPAGDYVVMLKNTFVRAESLPTTLSVLSSHSSLHFRRLKNFSEFPAHAVYSARFSGNA